MRVYVKKEDKGAIIPAILVTGGFLSFSIGIFIAFFKSDKSFVDTFSSLGLELLIAIVLFGFGLYFIYIFIKSPRAYKAKLIDKKIEDYNGKKITYMTFYIPKENGKEDMIQSKYKCYTLGENNLIVENDYSLRIKEANWKPKYVEELQNCQDNGKNKIKSTVPNVSFIPVYLFFELIFGSLLLTCILGIIMYPHYAIIYIIFAILFSIALFKAIKGCKQWKLTNNPPQNEQDSNQELEKLKPLNDKQEKVGNIVIKQLLIILIILPIIWLIIIMNINVEKEDFLKAYLMILFVELPIIIKILYNIGYDERLIKRHKINIIENINITNTKYFNIFRPTKDAIFPQYFLVDQNKNLILKIKKSNFIGNRFVICNPENIKIGEIKAKLFSLTNEFVIRIINEKPFIIRPNLHLYSNYQVIGRDYYVKGDMYLIKNIIYDNKDNVIAYMSTVSKNNNWYELGNTEVVLNENVDNSIDIMIIALSITMQNFQNVAGRKNS